METSPLPSLKPGVQPLDTGVTDDLNRAVQAVVRNKYLMDVAVADHGASMLARDLHDGALGPHEPLPFLCHILPFYRACERVDDGTPTYEFALVPTSNTLGCSWRWRRTSLSESDLESCRDKLTDFVAMADGKVDDATYAWVKPLGIFAPCEGKNRVDFFREEGIESIPARVFEWTYPEASRIEIYDVKKGGFSGVWAVLDGRWVEPVPNPTWTLPLLRAYGAKTAERWPASFPEPEQVQLAFFQRPGTTSPLGNPDFGEVPVADLHTIMAIQNFKSQPVRIAPIELRHVKIDHRVWLFSLAAALIACVLLVALPSQWTNARVIAGIALGSALAVGVTPYMVPFMTTKRGALAKGSFLPLSLAPKAAHEKTRRSLG